MNAEPVRRIIDAAEPIRMPHLSDDALALAYVERFGTDLRYCATWNRWLLWEGGRWRQDETIRAFDLARRICRDHAAQCNDARTSMKLTSAQTVAAVEKLARCDRRVAATVDQWDRDPDALNTPSGTVDLRAGELRPHRREDHLTKITAVAPAPAGTPCSQWQAFLQRVTGGDDDLICFLQRVAGYTLTGSTKEHALFFAFGTGRNGKSVFINTLCRMMGDYAAAASMETFVVTNSPQHPTDLASLRGARLVTAQETEDGRRWAEAKIKALTGGDPISARFMRQDFFTFEPQFKLLVAGNHKPGLRGVDEAMQARFNLIPFTVAIQEDERDPDLPEKLKAEWPAIPRWAIDGCLAWRAGGLQQPATVRDATAAYLADEDAFALWLDECCERDRNASESTADLFASWKTWAEGAGEFPGSQKRFAASMQARGFTPGRPNRERGYFGIRLIRRDYSEDPRWST